MKSINGDFKEVLGRREAFLSSNNIAAKDVTLLQVVYEGDDYCRYEVIDNEARGDGIIRHPSIISDALLTKGAGHALLLPIADCAPLVIFDEDSGWMMLSHLGRHSVEQSGAERSLEYFLEQTGVSLSTVRFWLGPAAGKGRYPLRAFEGKSLHEVILGQLMGVGAERNAIEVSRIDTTLDDDYYSHSNYLKGLQDEAGDGRFGVVAVMR